MSRLESVHDVAAHSLCSGCGVCAYMAPDEIEMVDARAGRRPLPLVSVNGRTTAGDNALTTCPGAALTHEPHLPEGHVPELAGAWGPVLELWEGYATDPEIRFAGSSGGVATALSLHCLDEEGMYGVLHTAARQDVAYLNTTVLSRSRDDLLRASGSRYAPASPGDGLALVEQGPTPSVFVGKPCDVAGVRSAAALRPPLAQRLGLTIAVFCAGTPTTEGTLEAVRVLGLDPDDAATVRYRGHGWPGRFTITDAKGDECSLSYEESWGAILQRHRQWRCMICPDHTGEFADVAVGDPWYRQIEAGDPGRSLVLARTEKGRRLVRAAIASGALTLESVSPDILPRSQPNLLATRGAVGGRLAAMRVLGMPTPRFTRLAMWPSWIRLDARAKARSTFGTIRRVTQRRLYRRQVVELMTSATHEAPADDR